MTPCCALPCRNPQSCCPTDPLPTHDPAPLPPLPPTCSFPQALLGKMRCLASLAEWELLSNLCRTEWRKSEPHVRREMALIAAHAAWHMGAWEEMAGCVRGGTEERVCLAVGRQEGRPGSCG